MSEQRPRLPISTKLRQRAHDRSRAFEPGPRGLMTQIVNRPPGALGEFVNNARRQLDGLSP
jgi:hypothetical protein